MLCRYLRLVQLLTAEDDVEWARLYSGPIQSLTTASSRPPWDVDMVFLSVHGIRLGQTLEVRMPVLKHEVDPAPRWLWRRATLARKASGRYFDAEDEKIRALVSRLSKGMSPEGKLPAELQVR